ncbi:hypothetical protein [Halostella salina]|uniref:hypothetical protein n=1 Tax=Halostella salina TaxID=1547897 RepID=UPI0013CECE3A|nr:hypothetical protein [Halostella salina]
MVVEQSPIILGLLSLISVVSLVSLYYAIQINNRVIYISDSMEPGGSEQVDPDTLESLSTQVENLNKNTGDSDTDITDIKQQIKEVKEIVENTDTHRAADDDPEGESSATTEEGKQKDISDATESYAETETEEDVGFEPDRIHIEDQDEPG